MNHKQAKDKLLTVKWKTVPCPNKDCWCAMIYPEEEFNYEEDEEAFVIGSGAIDKDLVEHIVEVHNQSLKISKL